VVVWSLVAPKGDVEEVEWVPVGGGRKFLEADF